jgi:hypothetical protein
MALRITGSVIGEPITSSSTSATGMWTSQEVAALQQDGIWQIAPTFTLTPSAATVNEGASITVTLTTTGIPNGAVVPYVITGANVTSSDGNISGNFVIQNNSNTISFAANADLTLEGAETLTITAGGASANVTINDTSRGGDSQFNYTTLLLNGDGTNNTQNNTFLDSSTNNFTITRNGNTTQGSFTPYGSNWSNYFDGTGDYLSLPSAATTYLAANPFTIEAWVYPRTDNGVIIGRRAVVTARGFWLSYGNITSKKFSFYAGDTNNAAWEVTLTTTNTFEPNQWHHVAVTRNASNVFTIWVNGVSQVTTTASFTMGDDSSTLYIGTVDGGNSPFTGYISNLRLVQNSAVYTSAFTPETTPLTAIAGTGLLTCQSNSFKDNSSTAAVITPAGDVSVQRFSPFSPTSAYSPSIYGGSAYFDGTGDYLELPPNSANFLHTCTAPWTIESWFYTSSTSAQVIFSTDADSVSVGINISLSNGASRNIDVQIYRGSSGNFYRFYTGAAWNVNAWNHFAVTYNGSTFSIYVNGVSQSLTISGTATFSASNATYYPAIGVYKSGSGLGNYITGWISNLRLVNGSAVYTSAFTPPTAPVTAISGTSLLCNFTNAGIIDNAMMNNMETVADSKISTAQSKFGGSAMYFDGTGDWLYSPKNWSIGASADFTIEGWFYLTAAQTNYRMIISDGGSQGYISLNSSGLEAQFGGSTATRASATYTFSQNIWYHIAVVRSSNNVVFYINGTALSMTNGSQSASFLSSGSSLFIGRFNTTTDYPWYGYMDDLRITNGYARYTSNFTPPTITLPGY